MKLITPIYLILERRKVGLRSISALLLREVSATHGASGGYAWAVVEPAAGIALMTLVFSLALREPALGDSFALFYATGMLPFTAFRETSAKIAKSLDQNKSLLAYPSVIFTDAILARFMLTTATQAIIWLIVLGSLVLVTDPSSTITIEKVVYGFILTNVLGLGLGIFNAMVFRSFPAWERIWNILNRPLFLISAIFYLYGDLPKLAQDILWFNPIIHIVGYVREGFYGAYDANYASSIFVLFIPMVTAVVGLFFLVNHEPS